MWSCTAWCSILGFVGSAALSGVRAYVTRPLILQRPWLGQPHYSSGCAQLQSPDPLCWLHSRSSGSLWDRKTMQSLFYFWFSVKIMRNQHEKSDSTDVITTIKYWLNFVLTGPYWDILRTWTQRTCRSLCDRLYQDLCYLHGVIAAKEGHLSLWTAYVLVSAHVWYFISLGIR